MSTLVDLLVRVGVARYPEQLATWAATARRAHRGDSCDDLHLTGSERASLAVLTDEWRAQKDLEQITSLSRKVQWRALNRLLQAGLADAQIADSPALDSLGVPVVSRWRKANPLQRVRDEIAAWRGAGCPEPEMFAMLDRCRKIPFLNPAHRAMAERDLAAVTGLQLLAIGLPRVAKV